jgi:hypothetical protein
MQVAILTSPITVGDYRELFGNTSFPASGPSDEFLAENNAKKVNLFKAHDRLTQKLVACEAYDDGEFVSLVQVVDLTEEEIQSAKDSAMANIRGQRNQMLSATDWRYRRDLTTTADWDAYCQALRDLPSNIEAADADPRTFTAWPRAPDYVEMPTNP